MTDTTHRHSLTYTESVVSGYDFWTGNYGPSYWQKSARGARVTFTATVEPSNDDPKFGFWKRPTKSGVGRSTTQKDR